MQVLDTAAGMVVDQPGKFDQRRAGMNVKRRGDIGRRQGGANALARMLDFDPGAFKQIQQWPRSEFLAGERSAKCSPAHNVVRYENGSPSTERTRTDRCSIWSGGNAERLRHRTFRRHIIEG